MGNIETNKGIRKSELVKEVSKLKGEKRELQKQIIEIERKLHFIHKQEKQYRNKRNKNFKLKEEENSSAQIFLEGHEILKNFIQK